MSQLGISIKYVISNKNRKLYRTGTMDLSDGSHKVRAVRVID